MGAMNGANLATAATASEARKIDNCTREAERSFRPTTEQIQDDPIDLRRALLAQAGAWDTLVSLEAMPLDEAFNLLVLGVDELTGPPPCEICLERAAGKPRHKDSRLPENWDTMSLDALVAHFYRNRPTPQATIEAIKQSIRERGRAAFKEPDFKVRISMCDAAARAELKQWIQARGRQ